MSSAATKKKKPASQEYGFDPQTHEILSPDLTELNTAELRTLCGIAGGRRVMHYSSRADMVAFLKEGVPLPANRLDDVRLTQSARIIDKYDFYRAELTCDACCFLHDDVQVVECQVQNIMLRHKNYPISDTKFDD